MGAVVNEAEVRHLHGREGATSSAMMCQKSRKNLLTREQGKDFEDKTDRGYMREGWEIMLTDRGGDLQTRDWENEIATLSCFGCEIYVSMTNLCRRGCRMCGCGR